MLILVRHGRTALNERGLLQGRIDEPLDHVGLAQAAAVAARVGDVGEVICSPLVRARETAAAFAGPVTVDERWIELSYGEFEGERVDAGVWDRWRGDTAFSPPGGESLDRLDERVRAACEELAPRAAERDIIVVSHVSPIKAAVAWALGVGVAIAWRCFLSPASVCRIDTSGSAPVLTAFNEVD